MCAEKKGKIECVESNQNEKTQNLLKKISWHNRYTRTHTQHTHTGGRRSTFFQPLTGSSRGLNECA